MGRTLSNLVKNFAGRIHKIKYKHRRNDKKCETFQIKYKEHDCFLEYSNFKDDLRQCKCLYCNKYYQKRFDENLKNKFSISTDFMIVITEEFSETELRKNEYFYSHINMKDITDADYVHTKKVYKNFEIGNLGNYHHFYMSLSLLIFFSPKDQHASNLKKDYSKSKPLN